MPPSQRSTEETRELSSLWVALAATRRCTLAIMRATDENLLMEQVCAIIVDAGYRFCWVGAAEQNDEKTVRPLAWAGYENGYLSSVRTTWSDSELGQGPTGTAIRTRTSSVINDTSKDSNYSPWCVELCLQCIETDHSWRDFSEA